MTFGIWLSIAAIAVCIATVLHLRCIEKRMNAEYERHEKAALLRASEADGNG